MRGKGFTLVELLVTVAIISALIVFLLPQLNSFQRRQTLKDSTSDLQTAIRSAQNSAVSGVKCSDSSAPSNWYLKFTSDERGSYKTGRTCNGAEEEVKTYNLPASVKVSSVIVDTCSEIDLLEGNGLFAKALFKNISGDVDFDYDSNQTGCPKVPKPRKMEINLIDSSLSSDNEMSIIIENGGSIYLSPLRTSSSSSAGLGSGEANGNGESNGNNESGAGNGASPTPTSVPDGSGGSLEASPSPTPTPSPCTLTSASWSLTENPVSSGTRVGLFVNTSGNCSGSQVSFEVRESDIGGSGSVTTNPSNAAIINNQAVGVWTAEYQQDIWGLPEYYFKATLVGTSQNIQSVDPKLEVSQATNNQYDTPAASDTGACTQTQSLNLSVDRSGNDGYSNNGFGHNETAASVRAGNNYAGGFRFSLPVPYGSQINSAQLSLNSEYTNTSTIKLKAEQNLNSTSISGSSLTIANRTYFPQEVIWQINQNGRVLSPDIKSLIQNVVNQNGWVSNNNILIAGLNTNSTFAQFTSWDGTTRGSPPKLTLEYCVPSGNSTVILETIDDGYAINNFGHNQTADNVRIGRSSDSQVGPYDAGFRFSLPIPKNSTIASAYLSVYLHYTWDNLPVMVNMKTENTINSAPLSGWDSSTYLPNRNYFTNSVAWTLPLSSWNSYITSPDIKSLVQSTVNQNGWVSGNNILVALLRTDDANFAQLISKDAFFPQFAKLTVTYTSP